MIEIQKVRGKHISGLLWERCSIGHQTSIDLIRQDDLRDFIVDIAPGARCAETLCCCRRMNKVVLFPFHFLSRVENGGRRN